MSNEVSPVTIDPDATATFDVVTEEELAEGELEGVSAGIIVVCAPQSADTTQVISMRKAGGTQNEY
jgi:hypothetical protein